jgi:hypothetical protein
VFVRFVLLIPFTCTGVAGFSGVPLLVGRLVGPFCFSAAAVSFSCE